MTPAFASETFVSGHPPSNAEMLTPRVALLCDFHEEQWPSMDLVGDMLFQYLAAGYPGEIAIDQVVPAWHRRFSGLPLIGNTRHSYNADRLINRFSDYPRWLRIHSDRFDLFHIVDHSYAQLVHELPPERTIVTCHDLDTFHCLFEPKREPRPRWFRAMMQRTLKGFQQVAHVICVSEATRDELRCRGWFRDDQLSVIHSGVHPDLSADPDAATDDAVRRLVGDDSRDPLYLLHVGTNVPRKRIDVLLQVFAAVLKEFPQARLVKAGEALDGAGWALAHSLGLQGHLVMAPNVDRGLLAALYRNAAVLLQTSDAEGFGLPVIEALACGCPVVASNLFPLREAGGVAALYCPVGDIAAWGSAVNGILRERFGGLERERRRAAGRLHAARFSWVEAAKQTLAVYRSVLDASKPTNKPAQVSV